MPRHEWWRLQYREDRYLEALDGEALRQRTNDVFENTIIVNEDLKVGVRSVGAEGEYWIVGWTHVLEEWEHRVHDHFYGIDKNVIPHLHWPGVEGAISPFKLSRQQYPSVIVKYGKTSYLRALLEEGEILIKPASSFDDASLNRAIRDDELSLDIYVKSRLYEKAYAKYGYALSPPGPRVGRSIRRLRAPTNYYVHCFSTARDLRLFGAFDANACLVVSKPIMFAERLGRAVSEYLGGWRWFGAPIEYIDPLRPPADQLDVVRCKNFRFAYQSEYRVAWLPPESRERLEQFKVKIGNLQDIAELIELPAAG